MKSLGIKSGSLELSLETRLSVRDLLRGFWYMYIASVVPRYSTGHVERVCNSSYNYTRTTKVEAISYIIYTVNCANLY